MRRRNLFWFFNIGNSLLCSVSQKQITLNYNPTINYKSMLVVYIYKRIKIYILTVPVRVEFVGINGTILRLQFSVETQRRKIEGYYWNIDEVVEGVFEQSTKCVSGAEPSSKPTWAIASLCKALLYSSPLNFPKVTPLHPQSQSQHLYTSHLQLILHSFS